MQINWLFNGSKITTNDGVLISKVGHKISTLSLDSVRPRHAGNYTCIAKNIAGETNYTSELRVIGKPKILILISTHSYIPLFLKFSLFDF